MVINAVTIYSYSTCIKRSCSDNLNSQSKRYEDIRTARQSKMTNGLGNVLYGTA